MQFNVSYMNAIETVWGYYYKEDGTSISLYALFVGKIINTTTCSNNEQKRNGYKKLFKFETRGIESRGTFHFARNLIL